MACATGTYMLPEHTGVKIEWPKKKSSVGGRADLMSCLEVVVHHAMETPALPERLPGTQRLADQRIPSIMGAYICNSSGKTLASPFCHISIILHHSGYEALRRICAHLPVAVTG